MTDVLHAHWKVKLEKDTSRYEIHYHIADYTNLGNTSLKQLLSQTETKQQLIVYLSEYVISEFERLGIYYVVSFDTISRTNQCLLAEILHHSHEEADTILIMHCWEIVRTNPLSQ